MFKAGNRIAHSIVEKIADSDAMEVDDLERTERGKISFKSNNLNPKRSITVEEEVVKICFLHATAGHNEFFSATYTSYHPRLRREKEMLSSAHLNAALT